VLLVQKEVAERICAKPGGMSVLSISVQAYGEPEIVDIVKAESFFPQPKVDSAILKISNIKYQISKTSEKDFFRTVKVGFAARRKTLLNNLSAGYRVDKATILNVLKTVKLSENVRAQELSIENWEALAANIKLLIPNDPKGPLRGQIKF
jgi:16S rRNA (adenine1518-N6/adenine1519-N6)-dimethyltransferase